MSLFTESVRRSLAKGLLVVPTKRVEVCWTPSVEAKLKAAATQRGRFVELTYPDMIVGTYHALRTVRDTLRTEYPFLWLGTDIHHIVENQHLQFIGQRGVIGGHSYTYDEPCVLLPQDHHRLLMHSLIGGSQSLHQEERRENEDLGIDYIRQYNDYRKHNKIIPAGERPTRTEKALHRADWVSKQPSGTRRNIGGMLLEIYEFAYQQSEEAPLGQIASDEVKILSL